MRDYSRTSGTAAAGIFPVDHAVLLPHVFDMDLKSDLLAVADRYCAATGMSKARLATILANDGKFFERIESGGGFTIRRFEESMRWLSEHWPDETKWPGNVMRPRDRSNAA